MIRPPAPHSGHAGVVALALVAAIAIAFPFVMRAIDAEFYVSVASRILIYGIAATSLNLILGYGGLVSFGHAAFFGIGAYAVGIGITEGLVSGWFGFPLAMAVAALAAAAIGAVSLRTRGVYFIMITLAFAQMLYYLVNSVKAYGGDEGLNIRQRSSFGFGLNLKDDLTFYFVVLACTAATLLVVSRLMRSRFGRVVLAMRDDDLRAEAIGFPTFRFKLILFVIGAALGGLAGALMVNQQNYVNPNVLHWTQSGTLMVMVILGGVGTLWGGLLGAAALLVLEEVVSAYTVHWQFYVGWVLLAIVLFAPRGLVGLAERVAAALRGRSDTASGPAGSGSGEGGR
jgi:branched-chain amino acid transport system permease protein